MPRLSPRIALVKKADRPVDRYFGDIRRFGCRTLYLGDSPGSHHHDEIARRFTELACGSERPGWWAEAGGIPTVVVNG